MSWEPTKVVCKCGSSLISRWTSEINEWQNLHKVCLNTVSPIKEWVGLTDDQMRAIAEWQLSAHRPLIDVIKAVEQALKEKNT